MFQEVFCKGIFFVFICCLSLYGNGMIVFRFSLDLVGQVIVFGKVYLKYFCCVSFGWSDVYLLWVCFVDQLVYFIEGGFVGYICWVFIIVEVQDKQLIMDFCYCYYMIELLDDGVQLYYFVVVLGV